ncbi:hypothetical protein NECAME_10607 [Necator americanus]|uniref:RRM domain-containing protein n=1 Tax=Necator americanus TaxID=51031 RepID=W2TA31_NECAM|nr:hypothetical protein NECAME_10607 [Necator americanus]ETN78066.1 hypothetical protein NECAME_10607 [Necator americanus]
MIPSFTSSPVYDMSTGIYYTAGATAVIPTPAYELIPHRVFVGGFPASTTELELREHFEQFFTIKEVKVIRSADGVSKGYGFITFDTDDEADTVRGMSPDKLEFKGRKLNLGPALRRMSQRYSTDYAIATPTGLVQSPTYGYTYSFPPQPPFVMVNAPQAYVYAPGSPVPQAMIYPVAAPANPQLTVEQPAANAATNGAANTPDGSPTRATVQNGEVVVPAAAKIPATPPATAASSSLSVVAAPAPPQQPQACIQYPVYVQPQAPPTPITPSVMAHPRGSPSNVYNSPQITSVPSAQYFSNGEGHGMQYQQTFYYNNTPMAAAGDAANMQMMYSNGAPATPIYGGADYTPQPAQQPHDSPPIAQGLFTPSPHHHGGNPQESTSDGWSNALKKELDEALPNKKDLSRKTIVFCDDAVNVKVALKEQSRDREESQSQPLAQDVGSGDCKFESQAGMNHRLGPPGRNVQKRPPRRQRSVCLILFHLWIVYE